LAAVAGTQQLAEEQVFERSFEVSPGGSLTADVPDSDFEIRTGNTNAVMVSVFVRSRDAAWGREVFDRMEFTAQATSNGVTIRAVDPRIARDEWRSHRGIGLTTRIVVPARFDLDVHTADGDVHVLNDIEGSVALRSSDGDIRIEGVRGERVVIETSDGDIDTRAIVAANVSVRTSDGDITMRGISGELDARTSDGDVSIELADIRGATVTTHDGDIYLYAPHTLRADVTLEGEDLSVDRGLAVSGPMSSRRIRGALNGGGARILARTNDGEIDFRIR
jgi:DUF4097 and DUF4098 domain-containing protein YvlB